MILNDSLDILIVEDELIIAEDMRFALESGGNKVVGIASSFEEAVDALRDLDPDLVLLDININGEKDGVAVAKMIDEAYDVPYIYVTSYADEGTMKRVMNTKPSAYLNKPFTHDGLRATIAVAWNNFWTKKASEGRMSVKDAIFVKQDHLFTKVKLSDVQWVKGAGNYLEISCQGNVQYLIRNSFKSFMKELPEYFFQCHKSYIINLNDIEAVSVNHVMIGKEAIPLSKTHKDDLFARLSVFS
ncbi:hypothetical protein FUAX_36380 [Fulvitalea axinellae]|uniref:Response regulator transcription factor n=1 Tax=Fulvitalea axinellae TaxID=1182444 RepID=A0AAU9CPY5_9BACT|nr:hypothetical protein FUAX_36380 [Fulvitalea axinellae]